LQETCSWAKRVAEVWGHNSLLKWKVKVAKSFWFGWPLDWLVLAFSLGVDSARLTFAFAVAFASLPQRVERGKMLEAVCVLCLVLNSAVSQPFALL